ncbi:hypothetical protein ACOSQ3_013239 [Xanthoceras sorbifolium]
MGDFNEIVSSEEKRGGRVVFSKSGFAEWIYRNKMVDIGFIGRKYTWKTNKGVGKEIWVRLDKAICSMDWRVKFSERFIRHLPRLNSDHCPILLHLDSPHIPRGILKLFRFKAMWLKHEHFPSLILDKWDLVEGNINLKLHMLSEFVKNWNKVEFGCIFNKKKRVLARLQGIQNNLSRCYNKRFVILEENLITDYNKIIDQEEIFWL